MYQNDEDQLFKAVEHGELEQVKNIIDSKQVDISALNRHEPNIVNHLLNKKRVKDKDAKLRILISAGALPKIDQNNNFLMRAVVNIENIAIRNEILTTVAQSHPKFNEYYREFHVQAIHGVKPEKDQALKPDGYGLYPIHYAIAVGTVTESWFESELYDMTKTIETGLYQGTSISWWQLKYDRFDEFIRLTHGLTPAQCYEILKPVAQNPQSPDQGISVAWWLLDEGDVGLFDRLTQGFTTAQCYEILQVAPQNPLHSSRGITNAWLLLNHDRYKVFNRLTQNLMPEQCCEILTAALQSPEEDDDDGLSVARLLIYTNEGCEEFSRLTQELTLSQRDEILKAGILNPKIGSIGSNLLRHQRFADFSRLTLGFTPTQCCEILKAAVQDSESEDDGISDAWLLLYNHRFDDFNRLARDLTPEQYFEILKSAPLNSKHDSYMQTVFVLLLNNKLYDLLLNLTRELNKEPLKELLFHPLYKKAPNNNNVEQYSTVMKVMMESHSDFAYNLFNQYTYEDLILWYNSIESNDIESQLITYLCFSKLHEILHVRFTNPPEALTEEYKEDISKQLADLFSYYQQILFQSSFYKEVADKLGMLLAQSSETIFRKIVIKYLEESGNQDYEHISRLAGNYVLEGYAHALSVMGNTSNESAILLGIIHAQVKEQASNLVKENEKLKEQASKSAEENIKIKEQASKLAEENKKLKEEVSALRQPPESSTEEPNNSQRNKKRPIGIFAAAESYQVKKSKREQAEVQHDLKGERQLR